MADHRKKDVRSVNSAGDVIDEEIITTPVLSEESSLTNSLKDLSPVVEELCLSRENREDDDIPQIESRSQSAEPLRSSRHLSGPNDSIGPLVPPLPRRQVVIWYRVNT